MDKLPFFYRWADFNTMQDMGAAFVGRIKNFIPDFSPVVIELGAWTIIFNHYNLNIPTYAIVIFLILRQYFWTTLYYFSGKFIRKVGLVKAQSEYLSREEDLSPVTKQTIDTLENIARAVGAETAFDKYRGIKLKSIPEEFKK